MTIFSRTMKLHAQVMATTSIALAIGFLPGRFMIDLSVAWIAFIATAFVAIAFFWWQHMTLISSEDVTAEDVARIPDRVRKNIEVVTAASARLESAYSQIMQAIGDLSDDHIRIAKTMSGVVSERDKFRRLSLRLNEIRAVTDRPIEEATVRPTIQALRAEQGDTPPPSPVLPPESFAQPHHRNRDLDHVSAALSEEFARLASSQAVKEPPPKFLVAGHDEPDPAPTYP